MQRRAPAGVNQEIHGENGHLGPEQGSPDLNYQRRFRSESFSSSSSSLSYIPSDSDVSWSPHGLRNRPVQPYSDIEHTPSDQHVRMKSNDDSDSNVMSRVQPPPEPLFVRERSVDQPDLMAQAGSHSNLHHTVGNWPDLFTLRLSGLLGRLTILYILVSILFHGVYKRRPIRGTKVFNKSIDMVGEWVEIATDIQLAGPPASLHELLNYLDRETLKPMLDARPSIELYCNYPPTERTFPSRWEKTIEPLADAVPSLITNWNEVVYSDFGLFSCADNFVKKLNEQYSICEYIMYPVIAEGSTYNERRKADWFDELYSTLDSMFGPEMLGVTVRLTDSVSQLKENLGSFLTSLPLLENIQEDAIGRMHPKAPLVHHNPGAPGNCPASGCRGESNNDHTESLWLCKVLPICVTLLPSKHDPGPMTLSSSDYKRIAVFRESLVNNTFFQATLHNETFMTALQEAYAWARKIDTYMDKLRIGPKRSHPRRLARLHGDVLHLRDNLREHGPDQVGMMVAVSWRTWLSRAFARDTGSDRVDRDEAGAIGTYCPWRHETCLPHPDDARSRIAILTRWLYFREARWNLTRTVMMGRHADV